MVLKIEGTNWKSVYWTEANSVLICLLLALVVVYYHL